jgi:Xaa-Pro dipeptidase
MMERLLRLADRMREDSIEHVLLCSAGSLRYFAGYSAPIETGVSPFTSLAGALLWIRGQHPIFLLADMEPQKEVAPDLRIESFRTYTFERPLGAMEDLAEKIAAHVKAANCSHMGIEGDQLPSALLDRLRSSCPRLQLRDITGLLSEIRVIKDGGEIEIIRQAVGLCDIGQKAAKEVARPGVSEIELFQEVRGRMETAAGERLPLLADLVSGSRTSEIGGSPSARKLETGDSVLVDLAPRLNGYWGDSCNTCIAGEPTHEQQKVFADVSAALGAAIAAIRPGMRACDLDFRLRQDLSRIGGVFPHHSGHGLGVAYHEEPRIVPYNETPLRQGMVIALEPGVYFPERWGLRLESVVHVTENGTDLLTGFRHTL